MIRSRDEELMELSEWLEDDSEVFTFGDLDWFENEDDDGVEKRRGTLRVFPYEDSDNDGAEWLEELLEDGWIEDGEFEDWLDEMKESWDERWPRSSMERRFEFDRDIEEWLEEFLDGDWIESDEFEEWLEEFDREWDGGWYGIPGQRSFEFDTDDGHFKFRGEWRYGDSDDGDYADKDDKDKPRYHLAPNEASDSSRRAFHVILAKAKIQRGEEAGKSWQSFSNHDNHGSPRHSERPTMSFRAQRGISPFAKRKAA